LRAGAICCRGVEVESLIMAQMLDMLNRYKRANTCAIPNHEVDSMFVQCWIVIRLRCAFSLFLIAPEAVTPPCNQLFLNTQRRRAVGFE
jgi:hypothetical protein